MFKMLVCLTWSALVFMSHAAVLDPALYLSPSPPLTGDPQALDNWSKAEAEPSAEAEDEEQGYLDPMTEGHEVPQARTFWPAQPHYGIRGIHIPLTFTLTGSYGHSGPSTGVIGSSYTAKSPTHGVISSSYTANTPIRGVIGSSYATVSDDSEDSSYGKSGLAGSSYGLYRSGPGIRVYGGSAGAQWSGWGNGKWGHYGKG